MSPDAGEHAQVSKKSGVDDKQPPGCRNHPPGSWEQREPRAGHPPLPVGTFACWYKCRFMFLKGCILSERCDIFWKEFQRALCKVLNKLLNKIETESAEIK